MFASLVKIILPNRIYVNTFVHYFYYNYFNYIFYVHMFFEFICIYTLLL